MEFILNLFTLANIVSLALGIGCFLLVTFVGRQLSERDNLKSRMKAVAGEKERLRQQSRQPEAVVTSGKLRMQQASLLSSLSELIDLQRFMQSNVREKLRQAGLRGENHVYAFVLARLAGGPVLALLAAFYSTILISELSTQMWLGIIAAGGFLGYFLPGIMLQNLVQKRLTNIRRSWPEGLDILLICVESGMGLEPALARVAREIGTQSVPLAEELTLTCAELSYLQDRRKAYENLAARVPLPMVKSVVLAFIQSERYGTPLGQALRVLATETRELRMQEAERKAAALSSKLTVPMILFFLPVVFVTILAPSILKVMAIQSTSG